MATTSVERWNLQDLNVSMSLLPESGLLVSAEGADAFPDRRYESRSGVFDPD